MKSFTILVDLDDVLINTRQAWVKYLNNKYNRSVVVQDINKIDSYYSDLSYQDIQGAFRDQDFWKTVTVVQGAKQALYRLMSDGHQIYICTASTYFTLKQKLQDLVFKEFPFLSWQNFIVCQNKKMINCDFIIDDTITNINGHNGKSILLSTMYNKNIRLSEYTNVSKFENWNDIYNYISRQAVVKDEDIN